MRLLVILDTYVPARISGALQMRDMVREMLAQGHQPAVLVPAPGLDRAWRMDQVDGVDVLRVRTPQTKDVGKVRRALAEWWLPYGLLRGLRRSPLAAERWQGLVWYSPTIFLGPIVRILKRENGCRGYLILRDLFPDWAVDAGILRKGWIYRWFKHVERQQYAVADVIGVQTSANTPLVRRDSPAGAVIEVLNNWLAAPAVVPTALDLSSSPLAGRTVFAYTGNMGAAQGMDALIDLARDLRERRDLGFLFLGRGSDVERLQARVAREALDNVLFIDEIDAEQVPAVLAQCQVGLIALDPRHTTHNIPGKLLTYLHAGLPVLASINAGNDLQALINDSGIGRVVVAGDGAGQLQVHAEALADSPALRAAMGLRGRALVQTMFSPDAVVRQVVAGLSGDPLAGG